MTNPLEFPEDYLWINYRTPDDPRVIMTCIDQDRIYELVDGHPPFNEREALLVLNPHWLRFYFSHVIGEYVIHINSGGPLPKFAGHYVLSCVDDEQYEDLVRHGVVDE
jgi:hypothetical protein